MIVVLDFGLIEKVRIPYPSPFLHMTDLFYISFGHNPICHFSVSYFPTICLSLPEMSFCSRQSCSKQQKVSTDPSAFGTGIWCQFYYNSGNKNL